MEIWFVLRRKMKLVQSSTKKINKPTFFQYGRMGLLFAKKIYINKNKCNYILSDFLRCNETLEVQKIKSYAAKITTFFGQFYEILTQKKLSGTYYKNLCLAGAITPIYDRFCDNYDLKKSDLHTLTFNPVNHHYQDPYKDIYVKMLFHLRKNAPNIQFFNEECERVMNAQFNSRKQTKKIDIKTIELLTIEKGGASFLFCASTINQSFNNQQKNLFYQLGAFVQLIDDIFDIPQDLTQGIETIATKHIHNIDNIKSKLEKFIEENFDIINKLTISKKQQVKLIRLYDLLAIPAIIYLKKLKDGYLKKELLLNERSVNPKYIWTGWNSRYFFSLCRYLITKNF